VGLPVKTIRRHGASAWARQQQSKWKNNTMCGIAGIWGDAAEGLVQSMMERIVHRGPDGSGVFIARGSRGALGHRRLAIMDPEGGAQPIIDASRRSALVANGEIYNYRDLARPLRERYHFRTRSDSETILHLFDACRTAATDSLDGMFAFAIADGDQLFAARVHTQQRRTVGRAARLSRKRLPGKETRW
jgi:asparagine synthase (glutamine-hydrolysing)